MNDNLKTMVENLNVGDSSIDTSKIGDSKSSEVKTEEVVNPNIIEVKLTNFYEWFEKFSDVIPNVLRVKTEVSKVNEKDCMIFKLQKGKSEEMELITFYDPSTRPILNLQPVYAKVYKNDTFEVLHLINENTFVKSYGVKTGLIVVYCVKVNDKIIPYAKEKIKKKNDSLNITIIPDQVKNIQNTLQNPVNKEIIQLLYPQSIKFKDEFTTKEVALNWFIERQKEVIDINHLLKIDTVLMNIMDPNR